MLAIGRTLMGNPKLLVLDQPLYRSCYNTGLPHAPTGNVNGTRFCEVLFYPRLAADLYDMTGGCEASHMQVVFDETYRQMYRLANYK